MNIVKGSGHVEENGREHLLLSPGFVNIFGEDHQCIFGAAPWPSAVMMVWKKPVGFCQVAEDFCYDTFKNFAHSILECNWPVGFGPCVVWFSWFTHDDCGGGAKALWEIAQIEGGLQDSLEVHFDEREGFLKDLICDAIRSWSFVRKYSTDSIADLLYGDDWLERDFLWVMCALYVSKVRRWRCREEGFLK